MTSKKNIIKIGAALINNRGELLIVRKEYSDIYINPGGKVKVGETHQQTLTRELKEELGIDLVKAEFFKTYHSERAEHDPDCSVTMHLYLVEWSGNPQPAAEIYVMQWLDHRAYQSHKYRLAQFFQHTIPDLRSKGLVKI